MSIMSLQWSNTTYLHSIPSHTAASVFYIAREYDIYSNDLCAQSPQMSSGWKNTNALRQNKCYHPITVLNHRLSEHRHRHSIQVITVLGVCFSQTDKVIREVGEIPYPLTCALPVVWTNCQKPYRHFPGQATNNRQINTKIYILLE